jgi:hypothetical protein
MLNESFLPFFDWCGRTWLGTIVRDTIWAFPLIESIHLLALAILLGTVLIINLRAFGIGIRYMPDARAVRDLEPWLLTSVALMIVTGIPMFLSETQKCYESVSFPIKMVLLLLAIVWHFAVQHRWTGPQITNHTPLKAKLAACVSILLWLCIGAAGKGIPYV